MLEVVKLKSTFSRQAKCPCKSLTMAMASLRGIWIWHSSDMPHQKFSRQMTYLLCKPWGFVAKHWLALLRFLMCQLSPEQPAKAAADNGTLKVVAWLNLMGAAQPLAQKSPLAISFTMCLQGVNF